MELVYSCLYRDTVTYHRTRLTQNHFTLKMPPLEIAHQ